MTKKKAARAAQWTSTALADACEAFGAALGELALNKPISVEAAHTAFMRAALPLMDAYELTCVALKETADDNARARKNLRLISKAIGDAQMVAQTVDKEDGDQAALALLLIASIAGAASADR